MAEGNLDTGDPCPACAHALATGDGLWCEGCGLLADGEHRDEPIGSPNDLRRLGWSVAVHNDFRLNGEPHTFWLMTNGARALKGEGRTDAEALQQIRERAGLFDGNTPLRREAHLERHREIHQALDELLADFLMHNRDRLPSKTSVMELLEWNQRHTAELEAEAAGDAAPPPSRERAP